MLKPLLGLRPPVENGDEVARQTRRLRRLDPPLK